MSGGVDSSVAAHLLLEQGHEVIGVFMRHGQASPVACAVEDVSASRVVPTPVRVDSKESNEAITKHAGGETPRLATLPIINRLDHKQGCCTASDAEDARRVADRLAIPFYALNLDAEFSRIIDYFVDEYAAGRTPNPCVQCNNWIKFGKLFDYADSVDAEFVATGHYARMGRDDAGEATLLRGVDDSKDQSYVLFGIERRHLDRMLLPVGGYEKPEIRRLAGTIGLNVATKTARRSASSRRDTTTSSSKTAKRVAAKRSAIRAASSSSPPARSWDATTASKVLRSVSGRDSASRSAIADSSSASNQRRDASFSANAKNSVAAS